MIDGRCQQTCRSWHVKRSLLIYLMDEAGFTVAGGRIMVLGVPTGADDCGARPTRCMRHAVLSFVSICSDKRCEGNRHARMTTKLLSPEGEINRVAQENTENIGHPKYSNVPS